MPQFAKGLETITNIAILVALGVVLSGWLGFTLFSDGPPRYRVGDSLLDVQEVAALNPSPTLILYVNSTCQFCTQSVPFYSRIADEFVREGSGIRIVAMARQPLGELQAYLTDHGLDGATAVEIGADTNFVPTATPTLVLMDSKRRVEGEWLGMLDADGEEQVLAAIRKIGRQDKIRRRP